MTSTLPGLLHTAIERDPARPLVTYYDRASGERTELSGTTFANWVAKTANWLRDDLDVHDGSVVAIALPMHWHALVIAFATWSLGGCVTESPASSPDVLVIPPDRMMELADADAGEVVVTSLDPMGRPLEPRPDHVVDYTSAVRVHGDAFSGAPVPAGSAAYAGGSLRLDQQPAAAAALELAEALGITPGSRVLVARGQLGEAGLLSWGVPVIAGGGSLVLVSAGEDADTEDWIGRIAGQEQVTSRLGGALPDA